MLRAPLVSGEWLAKRLLVDKAATVKVIDASWHMPAQKRDPHKEFLNEHIPGAQFLDIDKVANLNHPVPHMLPTAKVFEQAMERMGISSSDEVIVYDTVGVAAASRTWWAMRAFGHDNVSVMNGGLPAWKAGGNPTESGEPKTPTPGSFKATFRRKLVADKQDVLANALNITPHFQLADARAPKGRWEGTTPEPRPGLENGHIPHSLSLPWTDLCNATPSGMFLKDKEEIEAIFKKANIDLSAPITTSCGSGLTACVLALSAFVCGKKDVSVYDGSWTEWALDPETPKLKINK